MTRRKKHKMRDWVQAVGSLWLVMMGILFLGDRYIFYQFFGLSLLAIGLLTAMALIVRKRRFSKIFKSSNDQNLLSQLRSMKPAEFEDFIADLYRRLGYATHRIGDSGDGGIDVTAKKNGVIHYIQYKKYISSKVSLQDVRDFDGPMADSLADSKGVYITTNIFSTDAVEFAKNNSIELIDGLKLLKMVKLVGK